MIETLDAVIGDRSVAMFGPSAWTFSIARRLGARRSERRIMSEYEVGMAEGLAGVFVLVPNASVAGTERVRGVLGATIVVDISPAALSSRRGAAIAPDLVPQGLPASKMVVEVAGVDAAARRDWKALRQALGGLTPTREDAYGAIRLELLGKADGARVRVDGITPRLGVPRAWVEQAYRRLREQDRMGYSRNGWWAVGATSPPAGPRVARALSRIIDNSPLGTPLPSRKSLRKALKVGDATIWRAQQALLEAGQVGRARIRGVPRFVVLTGWPSSRVARQIAIARAASLGSAMLDDSVLEEAADETAELFMAGELLPLDGAPRSRWVIDAEAESVEEALLDRVIQRWKTDGEPEPEDRLYALPGVLLQTPGHVVGLAAVRPFVDEALYVLLAIVSRGDAAALARIRARNEWLTEFAGRLRSGEL